MSSPTADAVNAFVESYADAMQSFTAENSTLEQCAEAITDHWSPRAVLFVLGHVVSFGDSQNGENPWLAANTAHLSRLRNAGLGLNIRKIHHHIEIYTKTSAQCRITWEIEPARGCPWEGKGWQWVNVYGWRDGSECGRGRGHWEFAIMDEEVTSLNERLQNSIQI